MEKDKQKDENGKAFKKIWRLLIFTFLATMIICLIWPTLLDAPWTIDLYLAILSLDIFMILIAVGIETKIIETKNETGLKPIILRILAIVNGLLFGMIAGQVFGTIIVLIGLVLAFN